MRVASEGSMREILRWKSCWALVLTLSGLGVWLFQRAVYVDHTIFQVAWIRLSIAMLFAVPSEMPPT